MIPPAYPLMRPARIDPLQAFQEAAAFHDQGRFLEAERLYQVVLKADRDHFGALCRLGVMRLQQGQFEDAVRFLRRAIRQDRRSADAQQCLASAFTGLERSEEAVAGEAAASLRLNPTIRVRLTPRKTSFSRSEGAASRAVTTTGFWWSSVVRWTKRSPQADGC